MVWMMLIMFFPVLGLMLLLLLPLWTALPIYLALFAISGSCHWLMMRSMRMPSQLGRKKMIGSIAVVLNWKGNAGQVTWKGEIWRAEASARTSLLKGNPVIIDEVSGLTLFVRPAEGPKMEIRSGPSCRRVRSDLQDQDRDFMLRSARHSANRDNLESALAGC